MSFSPFQIARIASLSILNRYLKRLESIWTRFEQMDERITGKSRLDRDMDRDFLTNDRLARLTGPFL